jgi:hypothetical protein
VWVSYSCKTTVTSPAVAGSAIASCALLSDAAAVPVTARARVEATVSLNLGGGVALTTSNTAALTYLVPAGHYVRIVSSISGTGSVSLAEQVEVTLG